MVGSEVSNEDYLVMGKEENMFYFNRKTQEFTWAV
jgi:hypothetical protein